MNAKYLVSGLGGGLDIVNAYLIYSALRQKDQVTTLGSVRPVPQNKIERCVPFDDSGCFIRASSKINKQGRYAEPRISKILKKQIKLFSSFYQEDESIKSELDIDRLKSAIISSGESTRFFVDGGGDALILTEADANEEGETSNPFEGGDSHTLEAISGLPNTFVATISVGLDIDRKRFENVIIPELEKRGAYFGAVNLRTKETQNYGLEKVLSFENFSLEPYFDLAKEILVLTDEDFMYRDHKFLSHTAVVTYHALKGNFGHQRTFVLWEPNEGPNRKKGVIVKPEYCWMYFFDGAQLYDIKKELNRI